MMNKIHLKFKLAHGWKTQIIWWALPCHYGGFWEARENTYGHQTGAGLPNKNKTHPRGKPEEPTCWEAPCLSAGSSWWQVGPGVRGEGRGWEVLQGVFLPWGVARSPVCAVGLCVCGACRQEGGRGSQWGFHGLRYIHNRRKRPPPELQVQSPWELAASCLLHLASVTLHPSCQEQGPTTEDSPCHVSCPRISKCLLQPRRLALSASKEINPSSLVYERTWPLKKRSPKSFS